MRVSRLVAIAFAASLLSCSPTESEAPPHTYQMGERVSLGHIIYTVFERQWHAQFGAGAAARVPQNRFYLLRIAVQNNGPSEAIIPILELTDDSSASFQESSDGDGVQDWLGAIRQVGPGETKQGYVLFDVPQKRYKLKLTDEEGKRTAWVDIPLTFDSDAPDVTTPLDPGRLDNPIKK